MSNLKPQPGSRRQREFQKRDKVLDYTQKIRVMLIERATAAAEFLDRTQGSVTSVQVFAKMRADGFGDRLDEVDPRFIGAVFRRGWHRIGYKPDGSHGRPVAQWTQRSE